MGRCLVDFPGGQPTFTADDVARIHIEAIGGKLRLNLLRTLRAAGRWEESERESRMALELDPRSLNIYTNLAWHLAAEGRYDEAEALGQSAGLLSSGRHGKEFYREMWDTIDMVKHRGWDGQGHLYSSKPPLLATIKSLKSFTACMRPRVRTTSSREP